MIYRPGLRDEDPWDLRHVSVTLVHQEYPTNFRYKKEDLTRDYSAAYLEQTNLNFRDANGNTFGDRGNFDVAVLNREFVERMFKKAEKDKELNIALKHLINKDNALAKARLKESSQIFHREVSYAIEVKFLHSFNSGNIQMLHEVIKDDHKLKLAYENSKKHIRPINLVFCSMEPHEGRGGKKAVIDLIKEYIENREVEDRDGKLIIRKDFEDVATIFVESFVKADNSKMTVKPVGWFPKTGWGEILKNEII